MQILIFLVSLNFFCCKLFKFKNPKTTMNVSYVCRQSLIYVTPQCHCCLNILNTHKRAILDDMFLYYNEHEHWSLFWVNPTYTPNNTQKQLSIHTWKYFPTNVLFSPLLVYTVHFLLYTYQMKNITSVFCTNKGKLPVRSG